MSETIASVVPVSKMVRTLKNEASAAVWQPRILRRRLRSILFAVFCTACTISGLLVLFYLLWTMAHNGWGKLTWEFLNSFPSRFAHKAGIKAALWGSVYLAFFTALFAIPVGVGAAIYLEEFSEDSRLRRVIDTNIANLAGVPSIVYGMLGLAIFVRFLGFGRSIVSGSLTMAILILPIIIVSAREALKAVPQTVRHAAYALGSTKWQAVRSHVLPAATPGILTGIILAMARSAGETAPLILIGALNFVAFVPEGPMDSFTVLPIQIFNWVSRPQESFHDIAAAGMIVLVGMLVLTNGLAIAIRVRHQRKLQW
jgi:phosphate transport system permease protein